MVLGSEEAQDERWLGIEGDPRAIYARGGAHLLPNRPLESTSILSAHPLPPLPSFRQPCSPAWRLGWFQFGLPSCHHPGPGPPLRPAVRGCISALCPSHPVALLRHDSTSNTKNASVRPMCCRPDSLSIAPRRAVVVVLRDTSRWLWFELCLQFVLHHVFAIRLAPSGPTPESLANVGGLVVRRVARFH